VKRTGAKCSWVDSYGNRLFGTFLKWDGDYAIARYHTSFVRIYKANMTFEMQ
jgi:hypothetical protein